jgi:hypothetical protein
VLALAAILFFAGCACFIVGISEVERSSGWALTGWMACVVGSFGLILLSWVALQHAPPLFPGDV